MFEGIVLRWRTRIDALVRCGVWGIAIVALFTALSFFGAAVFVFGQAEFGTIRTLLGFAGFFLVVALLAAIGLIVARTAVQSRIAQSPRRPPLPGGSMRAYSRPDLISARRWGALPLQSDWWAHFSSAYG